MMVALTVDPRVLLVPDAPEGQSRTWQTTAPEGAHLGSCAICKGEVRPGDRILLSDGLIELRAESSSGREIVCRVINGGQLGEHKGVNLPGVRLRVPALTPKDLDDLKERLQ